MMVYINFNLRCLFFCNFISQITSDEIVEKNQDAYFPCSAVMYSSQEIVLGAGAVSDCLLAGWAQENTSQQHIQSSGHHYYLPLVDKARTWNSFSHLKIVFADAASFAQALHDGFVPQDVLLT